MVLLTATRTPGSSRDRRSRRGCKDNGFNRMSVHLYIHCQDFPTRGPDQARTEVRNRFQNTILETKRLTFHHATHRYLRHVAESSKFLHRLRQATVGDHAGNRLSHGTRVSGRHRVAGRAPQRDGRVDNRRACVFLVNLVDCDVMLSE